MVVVVVVVGGLEGDFSVSFGPKLPFRLWIWTWTKLDKNSSGHQTKSAWAARWDML